MSGAQQQTNGHYSGNSGGGASGGGQNANGGNATANGTGAGQSNGTASGNGNGVGQLIYPALHLQPLNDTFAPKQISLAPPGPQNKIKIGRQTNNKTIPQPSNGYFDSKVLSRMHAEVWSQDGNVYIKDVKSSNGTFINGARLSAEGQESDTFELHTDDVVEFGIDIVGEDNKSIIHHKVACRVFLVMTAEEALGLRHDFAALYRGGIAGSTLNHHVVGPGAEGGLRRKMGSGGGGYGAGGSVNGMMSFDHILHRLQAELQKSRETAGELGSLNAAMSDIGETLGGGLPPMQNPPYQHLVPSEKSNDPNAAAKEEEQKRQRTDEANARAAELKALEDQVKETQHALQAHIDRLAMFESRLDDNEGIKADILSMQEQVRNAQSEAAEAKSLLASKRHALHDEDDDSASVLSIDTVVPGEENDDHLPARSVGKGPVGNDEIDSLEAIGHLDHGDDEDEEFRSGPSSHDKDLLRRLKEHIGPLAPADGVTDALDRKTANHAQNDDLVRRLEAMESQLEKALELGRNLADQHAEATENVRKLEERIRSLESEQKQIGEDIKPQNMHHEPTVKEEGTNLAEGALAVGGGAAAAGGILSILEGKWGKWRDAFEADFARDRAGLNADREEIRRVVKMWDTLNQEVEDLVEGAQTDDGGNIDENKTVSVSVANHSGGANTGGSKKKKKKKGGNQFQQPSAPSQSQIRRTTSAVGLGTSADLNRHLRALIYTDDYNLLVRETHMESEGSTSASSSVSDTSRSATSKMTDDTSVGSSGSQEKAGSSSGAEGGGHADLEELPDGVRKRAMVNLASGRRKGPLDGGGIEKRWPGFGSKAGGGGTGDGNSNGIDNSVTLPVVGAAGVLFVGMTAWIMAGKGGINLAGGMGGGG